MKKKIIIALTFVALVCVAIRFIAPDIGKAVINTDTGTIGGVPYTVTTIMGKDIVGKISTKTDNLNTFDEIITSRTNFPLEEYYQLDNDEQKIYKNAEEILYNLWQGQTDSLANIVQVSKTLNIEKAKKALSAFIKDDEWIVNSIYGEAQIIADITETISLSGEKTYYLKYAIVGDEQKSILNGNISAMLITNFDIFNNVAEDVPYTNVEDVAMESVGQVKIGRKVLDKESNVNVIKNGVLSIFGKYHYDDQEEKIATERAFAYASKELLEFYGVESYIKHGTINGERAVWTIAVDGGRTYLCDSARWEEGKNTTKIISGTEYDHEGNHYIEDAE